MTQGNTWERAKAHGSYWPDAIAENGKIVARVIGSGYPTGKGWAPESEQHANLIAAAPDLLAALEEVLRHCVTVRGFPDKGKGRTAEQQAAYDAARTAIAKAIGKETNA
jgi:hypothetical protein